MKQFIFFLLSLFLSSIFAQQINYEKLYTQYDYVKCYDNNGLSVVGNKSYKGVLDDKGNIIIPFIYNEIYEHSDSIYLVEKDGLEGFIDINNKIILPIEYEILGHLNNNLLLIKKNNKIGIIDNQIKWKLPCEYDEIEKCHHNIIYVKKDSLYAILDTNMQWLSNFVFTNIIEDKDQIFTKDGYKDIYKPNINISVKGKYGIIDSTGKILIPCKYEYIEYIENLDTYIVRDNNIYNIIDKNNQILLNRNYSEISYNDIYQVFIVKDSIKKYGILDNKLQWIEPIKYDDITVLGKDRYIVRRDSIYYEKINRSIEKPEVTNNAININICKPEEDTIHYKKKIISKQSVLFTDSHTFSPEYDEIEIIEFKDKYIAKVYHNGKYGVINENGILIIPIQYDDIELLFQYDKYHNSETLLGIAVEEKNKYGLYNIEGKKILPNIYEEIDNENTMIFAQKNNKYFLVDIEKGIINKKSYDDIDLLENESGINSLQYIAILVENKLKKGIVSIDGKELIPCKYDEIYLLETGYYEVKLNKKSALFNAKGEQMTAFIYDEIKDTYHYNVYGVMKDNLCGAIDSTGKYILACEYNNLEIKYDIEIGEYYFIANKKGQILFFNIDGKEKWNTCRNYQLSYKTNKGFGYCDSTGKEIIPFNYQYYDYMITKFNKNHYIIVKSAENFGLINEKSEEVLSIQYQYIEKNKDEYIIKQNNLYGLIDKTGKFLLDCKYIYINNKYFYYRLIKDNKEGLYFPESQKIIPCEYQELIVGDNYYIGKKEGKYGIINQDNNILIPFEYESFIERKNEFCILFKNNKYYLIYAGKEILLQSKEKIEIKTNYEIAHILYNNDIYLYNNKGKLIGKDIMIANYDEKSDYYVYSPINKSKFYSKEYSQYSFSDKLIISTTKYGLIDENGKEIVKPIYDKIIIEHENYIWLYIEDKPYILDKKNNLLDISEFQDYHDFSYGLLAVSKQEKWGFIDKTKNIKIPFQYDLVSQFYEGYSVVYQQEKCGLIDTTGKLIIPIEYDGIEILDETYLKVKKDCKFGIIDRYNQIKVPIIYDFIEQREYYSLPIKEPIIWRNKEAILRNPDRFDNIEEYSTQYEQRYYDNLIVTLNGKMGIIDMEGKILLTIEHEELTRLYNEIILSLKENGQKDIYNDKLEFLATRNVRTVYANYEPYFIFEKDNGKYELYNSISKKTIIDGCSERPYKENGVFICKKKGKSYLIDKNDNITERNCKE